MRPREHDAIDATIYEDGKRTQELDIEQVDMGAGQAAQKGTVHNGSGDVG